MKRIEYAILMLIIIVAVCCGCGNKSYSIEQIKVDETTRENSVEISTQAAVEPTPVGSIVEGEDTATEIYVYVCGAVESPGVYSFPPDALVEEAIKLAGGFTDDANKDYLNLARKLVDGEKIYVPREGELEAYSSITEECYPEGGNVNTEQANGSLVNINTASETELTSIPGVGPSRARDIISYREAHGGFKSVEDIMNVPGIKEGVFNKIKDYITI